MRRIRNIGMIAAVVGAAFVFTSTIVETAAKQRVVRLRNAFIDKYKNRVTLSTPYRVISYKTHRATEDGDAHVAGLPEDVGLACVAEIMNIKSFQGALRAGLGAVLVNRCNQPAPGELGSLSDLGSWLAG